MRELVWGEVGRQPWRSVKKKPTSAATLLLFAFLFFFFLFASLLYVGGLTLTLSIFSRISGEKDIQANTKVAENQKYPLQCTLGNQTKTCPTNYPTTHRPTNPNPSSCPSYFRWIHEDLRPWKESGITRDMIERAHRTAHFRLVIVNGKAYVEKYRQSIQTRDMFTLWGILQLLRWYPGKLPDLELMFDCDDRPVVRSKDFRSHDVGPPPLFRYCSDQSSLDIVFPDWSFWGWAETNIKPWRKVLDDIKEGNKRRKWRDRVPYAYWRGNPHVAPTRRDLLKCNVSDKNHWNTLLYIQDWKKESEVGYRQSNLEDQCTHRYKIYIEGWAWSVSEKYILACDSMTLYVKPRFFDFFIRGMIPVHHYWPIRDNSKCSSLKFAVEWGNNHTYKAQEVGEAGSRFILEDLKMEYVYDYMFHLLSEYGKLLRFKPTVPEQAVEVCSETMACSATGPWVKFMEDSMELSPSDSGPCMLPPPFERSALRQVVDEKRNALKQVEMWENQYYQSLNMSFLFSKSCIH